MGLLRWEMCPRRAKLHRYVWGSSSVGNVLVSDDSSNGTDFPEIVTAGMIDYSGNLNISVNNKTAASPWFGASA